MTIDKARTYNLETKNTAQQGFVFLDSYWTSPGLLDSHWAGLMSDFLLDLAPLESRTHHVAKRLLNFASFYPDKARAKYALENQATTQHVDIQI